MRLTMLFAGPFEADIDWHLIAGDPDRRPGVHHWLGRVFAAVGDAAERDDGASRGASPAHAPDDRGRDRRHGALPLQRRDLEADGADERDADALDAGGARAAEALTLMLAPFAPFAAEELWRDVLGHEDSVHVSRWPTYDEALAAEDTVTLVIQVDGKVRDKVEVPADTDEARAPWSWRALGRTGGRRPRGREESFARPSS